MKLDRSKRRRNVQRPGAQVRPDVTKQSGEIPARVSDVDGEKLQAEPRDAATEAQGLAEARS
jgi:hypothetical protein